MKWYSVLAQNKATGNYTYPFHTPSSGIPTQISTDHGAVIERVDELNRELGALFTYKCIEVNV